MDNLEDEDEKSNIYIINEDGKITNSEEDDSGKNFIDKLTHLEQPHMEQPHSSDGEEQKITLDATGEDAPVQKRTLFGPPSWNPEQLATAIKAVVQDGVSLTVAARENGIPRTTLANKIYGRKRRRTHESSSVVTSTGFPMHKNMSSSHTSVISSEHEKLLADFLARQRHVDAFSMTRAVLDLVKYFARERNVTLNDDEELKDWLKFFFLRYPSARFTVWHTEHGRFETEEGRMFVDFVLENSKTDSSEDVKRKLFSLVKQKVYLHVHLFWWYAFLSKHIQVKHYFLENLKWPNSILDDCHIECNDDEIVYSALTNMLLNGYSRHVSYSTNQNHSISPVSNQNHPIGQVNNQNHSMGQVSNQIHSINSLSNQNISIGQVSNQNQRVKLITAEHTDSPTQVIPRRKFDISYRPILPKVSSRDQVTPSDDSFESHDVNISSTSSKTYSFGAMLAQEGLHAVERKLSSEDLRYFAFRYDNPQLEEAFHIWKNLKMAVDKKEVETDSTSL